MQSKKKSMRILITGASGMLGSSLCPILLEQSHSVIATDSASQTDECQYLDVRNDKETSSFIKKNKPDLVFHLAAETDVDKCELNNEHAYETNAKGTENVAIACKEVNIPLVYISTGAVFDGEKQGGYTELDKPNPISVYGKSKLRGEEAVRRLLNKYYIVRAGWMIGGYDKDKKFVWKIIQLLKTKKEISAVTDKFGSPTFTNDFARGLLEIVSSGKYGLYHCVNQGICTRFDIAQKIVEYLNKKEVTLKAVTSEAFPLPAPRGRSEALLNYNLSRMGINHMRNWQEALREYINGLSEEVK